MIALRPDELEFSEAYIDGDESARWASAAGHSPSAGTDADVVTRYERVVLPDGSRERHTVE